MVAVEWIAGKAVAGSGTRLDILNPPPARSSTPSPWRPPPMWTTAVAAAVRVHRMVHGHTGRTQHRPARLAAADVGSVLSSTRTPSPPRPASRSGSPVSSTCPAPSTTSSSSPAPRHLQGSAAAEWDGTHTSTVRREAVGGGLDRPVELPTADGDVEDAAAVAAGNTIVLKPSELTPLTSLMVAEDATAAGMPDGSVQRDHRHRPGRRRGVDRHPVRMIPSPGPRGWAIGSPKSPPPDSNGCTSNSEARPRSLCSRTPIVEAAIQGAVAASLINTGQDCTAATRAYVHRSLYERFVDGVAR